MSHCLSQTPHLIASFGELSFNANQNHSRRNAGVVSDGSLGQTRVQLQSSPLNGDSNQSEASASNVAILLLIPEKTYMEELYRRHTSKHQTKEKVSIGPNSLPLRPKNELTLKCHVTHKISFLKSCFFFDNWPYDELVKMAYAMKKRTYKKGTLIAKQGDRLEFVEMILKGKIKVLQRLPNTGAKTSGVLSEEVTVEIAELECNDMFGIVEVIGNFKKMKTEAQAVSTVETYVIQ
jgi:hypothetical protein